MVSQREFWNRITEWWSHERKESRPMVATQQTQSPNGVPDHIPWKLQYLSLDVLIVDERAQREFNEKRARRIADNFHPGALGALSVAPAINGVYRIVDGQHRAAALRMLGHAVAPCVISAEQTIEGQARDFRLINTERRSVNSVELFKVRLTEGDPQSIEINQIVEACGYTISFSYNKTPQTIVAVEALNAVYGNGGADGLRKTLSALHAGWPGQIDAVSGIVIRGMDLFLSTFDDVIKRDVLIRQMQREPAAAVMQTAKARRAITRMEPRRAFASALFSTYNHGLSSNRLPARSAVLAE